MKVNRKLQYFFDKSHGVLSKKEMIKELTKKGWKRSVVKRQLRIYHFNKAKRDKIVFFGRIIKWVVILEIILIILWSVLSLIS